MKIRILLCCLFFTQIVSAQNGSFDNSLQQLTDALAAKLTTHNQLKMAVWDLSNLDGSISPIGKYIAEDAAINLSEKFHIVNRNQLNTLIKENHLNFNGYINQATIRKIKKLSGIDIIITGTVTILSNNIKITLQALDGDANIIAATKGDVSMNDDVRELLGINTGATNRGFNSQLSSNEKVNNPKTLNNECQKNKTGDYCFTNSTGKKIKIMVLGAQSNEFTLDIGQTQCLYELPSGVYKYLTYKESEQAGWYGNLYTQGQVKVEQCQSKTFEVK